MDKNAQIQSQWTVDKTLGQLPETSHIFIKYRMQCVGCYMQKFCTIQEVAEIYQVNLDEFLKYLNERKTK